MPLHGISDVTDDIEVLDKLGEFKRRAEHQETARPGEAFEFDVQCSPNIATCAVGTNQEPRLSSDRLPFLLCGYCNAILLLLAAFYGMPEQEVEVWIVF